MLESDGLDDHDVITMLNENGEEKSFVVVDAVRKDLNNYLLVVDADEDVDEEEVNAVMLKEIREEEEELVYEIVEDEEEFERVIELFQENEDFDIKL